MGGARAPCAPLAAPLGAIACFAPTPLDLPLAVPTYLKTTPLLHYTSKFIELDCKI